MEIMDSQVISNLKNETNDAINNNLFKESADILENIYSWIESNSFNNDSNGNRINEKDLLEFLTNLWTGREIGVDFNSLTEINEKPEWLKIDKLIAGQKFAKEYYACVSSSEIICLLLIISNDNVLRKLIWTGKSSDSYTSFKRYLSTGKRVRSWLTSDLFEKESDGYKNINIVNSLHKSFYNKLENTNEKEFEEKTNLNNIEGKVCPFLLKDLEGIKFSINHKDIPKDKLPMSQTEMLVTQFSFVGFLILLPEKFGVDPIENEKGLEGFVHLWRYIGYRLGTKDEFNLCSGTFEEVKLKSRILVDFVVKPGLQSISPRWEHMTRSIIEGLQFYTDTFSYEAHLMFGLDILQISYENLYINSSFISKLQLQTMKVLNFYLLPLQWFRGLVNNVLLKKINKVSENMPSEEEFKKKIK